MSKLSELKDGFLRGWNNPREFFTKRNAMYFAAAVAIIGFVLGLVLGSGWLWFTVIAQGYLLCFGTADDWR